MSVFFTQAPHLLFLCILTGALRDSRQEMKQLTSALEEEKRFRLSLQVRLKLNYTNLVFGCCLGEN